VIRDGKRGKINETALESNIVEIQEDVQMGSTEIPYPISNEEIWNSVDDRLAEELDSMGPYIGGYDKRSVLFPMTRKAPNKVKNIVPYFIKSKIDNGKINLDYDFKTGKNKYCKHEHRLQYCAKCHDGDDTQPGNPNKTPKMS
jgi:hypothetical protein